MTLLKFRSFDCPTFKQALIYPVDTPDFDTQREVLTELTYYGLALKGMDVEVPILVIDNDDITGTAFSFTYETYHGQDVITKLKEMAI